MAPVRFGPVTVRGWNGSSGSGFWFRRFLCKKRFFFSVFQHSLTGKDGSGSGFGSWKTVPPVPVPLSASGKMVPTVPVPGSSSVPEPPCNIDYFIYNRVLIDHLLMTFRCFWLWNGTHVSDWRIAKPLGLPTCFTHMQPPQSEQT